MERQGILAVDPGIRAAGYAIFKNGELLRCGLEEASTKIAPQEAAFAVAESIVWAWNEVFGINSVPEELVIEHPQVYNMAHSKGDPNDLLWLPHMAGVLIGMLKHESACLPLPREWKGQVDKKVMNNRILESLNKREREYVEMCLREIKPRLRHNTIDAIGIGQWFLTSGK